MQWVAYMRAGREQLVCAVLSKLLHLERVFLENVKHVKRGLACECLRLSFLYIFTIPVPVCVRVCVWSCVCKSQHGRRTIDVSRAFSTSVGGQSTSVERSQQVSAGNRHDL